MTNYLNEAASPAAAASGLDFRMDRRTKKPVMEKQRRDRMNRAMDELKAYLLKYDPAHSSKLEKADILERTCELIRRMELERTSPSNRVFIEGYFRGTSDVCVHLKNKTNTPEVQRLISDIMMNLRPPMPPPPQGMPMPTTPGSAPPNMPGPGMPTPPPMLHGHGQMVRPMMPPPPFFMGFPGMPPMQMPMTPIKFPVAPNNDSIIKPEPITPAVKKTDSPFPEEDIDVENVDDDSFSNPGSPETPSRKRKLSSTDDSGISEPSPKRLSPTTTATNGAFSIDSLLISKN